MTKKDYIAIAGVFKAERDKWTDSPNQHLNAERQAALLTCGYLAQRLAYVLKQDNAAFDRARFLAACGVQS